MNEVHQFLLTFYKIYKTSNSNILKSFYFNTFECEVKLDDTECDEADNSCLFDDLYDVLVETTRKKIQNIGGILYCDIYGGFLITYDESNNSYLINGEILEEDINEAAGYFYDLFNTAG